MTDTMVRVYANADDATAVAAKLAAKTFNYGVVSSVGPDGAALSRDQIIAALMKHWVLKSTAGKCADAMANGGAAVCVRAPFGAGVKAARILDSAPAVYDGPPPPPTKVMLYDPAAPFSSMLQFPPLAHRTSTHGQIWNLGPLLAASKPSNFFRAALLLSNPAPLSSLLGLGTVIDAPAPLSRAIGAPVLR